MTEEEIIAGCIKKKNDSQRLLFDKYAGKMMSLCLRYARDADAKDILQEGFLRVFDYIHQYRGEGNFEGWMRRVFVSVAMRHIAKKKITVLDIDNIDYEISTDVPDIIDRLSENEIHSLIRKLPDGYRTVFNLFVLDGYSHEEIADMLNIQASTSRTQLLKARKMLQGLIYKCCNTLFV